MEKLIFWLGRVLGLLFICSAVWGDLDLSSAYVYRHSPDNLFDGHYGRFETDHAFDLPFRGTAYWYLRFPDRIYYGGFQELARFMEEYQIAGLDLTDQQELNKASIALLEGSHRNYQGLKRDRVREEPLRYLNLQGTQINDKAMPVLGRMHTLEVLVLNTRITDKGAAELSHLQALVELGLAGSRITDRGLGSLQSLKRLTTLDLRNTRVTDAGLRTLRVLPLERVRLDPLITDKSAQILGSMPTLRHLDLAQSRITDKGLPFLDKLPKLHTLFLNTAVTDQGLQALKNVSSLRRLDLTGAHISLNGIGQIARWRLLEELALSQTSIDNRALPLLGQLPRLRYLEISDTQVTLEGLKDLALAKSLEVLSFSFKGTARLGDLRPLASLPKLHTIIVNGRPLGWEAIDYLRAQRQKHTNSFRFEGFVPSVWAEEGATALSDNMDIAQIPKGTGRSISAVSLSGLMRIHYVESELDQIIPSVSDPVKEIHQDRPENFLGEFEVHVQTGSSHKR